MNEFGISENIHQMWKSLIDKGWIFEIRTNKISDIENYWCMLLAVYGRDNENGSLKIVDLSEDKYIIYKNELDITSEVPFWIQFEDFIIHTDKLFHKKILPHLSGRMTDMEFYNRDKDD